VTRKLKTDRQFTSENNNCGSCRRFRSKTITSDNWDCRMSAYDGLDENSFIFKRFLKAVHSLFSRSRSPFPFYPFLSVLPRLTP
jgi:hypothetical protein